MPTWFDIFGLAILAACLSGAVCGVTGAFVVGLRVPLLAVTCAHLALAGAVWGLRAGGHETLGAVAGAGAGALAAVWFLRRPSADPNAVFGVLFATSMGVALLGLHHGSGPHTEALGLLWGNLLFAGPAEVAILAALLLLLAALAAAFEKQLQLILFSRDLSAFMIREALFSAVLLCAITATIAINLNLIGGLVLYSLLCNPAAAALALARSFRGALALAVAFGVASAAGGFALAHFFGWPSGASIAIVSAIPFLLTGLPRAAGARVSHT